MTPSRTFPAALVLIALGVGGLGLVAARAGEDAGDAYRLEAQWAWLFGRPDLIESVMPFRPEDALGDLTADGRRIEPVDVWPYALRDLWWRPADKQTRWHRLQLLAWASQRLEKRVPPALQAPYRWLLDGGDAPYPAPPIAEDPWPVLSTLILDRQRRMKTGARGYPQDSPLATRPPPAAWRDWWEDWLEGYLDMTVGRAYGGDDPDTWDEATREEEAALDERARGLARRNLGLALGALAGFVAVAGVLARGRRRAG